MPAEDYFLVQKKFPNSYKHEEPDISSYHHHP